MASAPSDSQRDAAYTNHEQRTADQTRAKDLHTALITSIKQATPDVRLIDFKVKPEGPFNFKAGQWVDCYTPASEQAGGFTIVSTPAEGQSGTFRLAIQKADRNPPAQWLWRPIKDLEGKQSVDVRIGGQFTFPPVNFRRLAGKVQSVVIVCAGIGINPMISILGALRDSNAPLKVKMLYGIRTLEAALFLDELEVLTKSGTGGIELELEVFVSGQLADGDCPPGIVHRRRISDADLLATIDQDHKDAKLYYICGPTKMTDWAQEYLLAQGVDKDVCQTERWW